MIKKRTVKANVRRGRSTLEDEAQLTSEQEAKSLVESAVKKTQSKPKPTFLSFDEEEVEPIAIQKKVSTKRPMSVRTVSLLTKCSKNIHEFKSVDKREKTHRHGTMHSTKLSTQKIVTPIALFDERDDRIANIDEPQVAIPDALTIKHLKEQRKRKREHQDEVPNEEEYISLNDSGKIMLHSDAPQESRHVREDDEDDMEEDRVAFEDLTGNRISFATPMGDAKKSVRDRVKNDDMMDEVIEDEDDQEDNHWELLQLKNAGVEPPPKPIVIDDDDILARRVKKVEAMMEDDIEEVVLSFEQLEKRLQQSYHALESKYKEDCQLLESTQYDMQEHAKNQSFFKQKLDDLSEDYAFHQEMKVYFEDLVDCLDNKVPEIEELEERLLKERARYYDKMHQNWIQDQLRSSKTNVGQEWWLVDYANKDGEYDTAVSEICLAAGKIFEDVQEEFSSVAKIKEKFEQWKFTHPDSYKLAHCGECAQKVFAPFVRLEILTNETQKWYYTPLARSTFVDFNWWQILLYYGTSEDEPTEDDDHMVPELIKKVITPLLKDTAAHAYNPLSRVDQTALHQLVEEYCDYVQVDQMKQVFEAIVSRLTNFTRDLKRPYIDATRDIVIKQFKCTIQLIESITTWSNTFATKDVLHWHNTLQSLIEQELLPNVTFILKLPSISQEKYDLLHQVPTSYKNFIKI